MLTEEQRKELDGDIKTIVDERVQRQVEDELAKQIVKRFTPAEAVKEPEVTGFKSFGEQLMAIKKFAVSGGREYDSRLKAPTGLSEGQPSEGGFLVQTDFATSLLEKAYSESSVLSRVARIPISANSNALKIPAVSESSRADGSRFGGIRAYWGAEAGTKLPSQPAFEQISLELKKLYGYCYATDELLEDAPALESWIRMAFTREFDFKLTDAILNGTGSGQPLGIENSPCTISVSAETSQAADTVLFENIIKMWARLYAPCRPNAVWLISQDIEPQLFSMSLAVGTAGVPVYMPAGGISGAPYGTLMGRPVLPVEQCDNLGDVGDIVLADLSQYIMIDKGGVQSASSIHVAFVTDQTVFRFVYRCDGQPWWRSALTPFNGGSTQSPFVNLAAR
uniref:Putative capsid protein n=1 Tax=viral metagenome TaxID=1070528 RepID=A0A6M3L0U7_9ZZZZ